MRAPEADDLLRRLARGVRPVGGANATRANPDEPDFTFLLSAARSGGLASGRHVDVPASLGVALTADEQDDLDRAADAADAGGMRTLAAIVESAALVVDVASRRAADARALRHEHEGGAVLIDGVEGVVVLRRAREDTDAPEGAAREMAPDLRATPATRIANASLLRSLADAASPRAQSGE